MMTAARVEMAYYPLLRDESGRYENSVRSVPPVVHILDELENVSPPGDRLPLLDFFEESWLLRFFCVRFAISNDFFYRSLVLHDRSPNVG